MININITDDPDDSGDLRTLYERAEEGPVARGDYVDGKLVLGFAFAHDAKPASQLSDRLLVEGDEDLDEPPERSVPSGADEGRVHIERSGPHSLHRIDRESIHYATEMAPYLPRVVDQVFTRHAQVGEFVRSLIDTINAQGNHVWLIGGGVRDLLTNSVGVVNDLDFVGTTLPGELDEIADELLRRAGLGDYYRRVSRRLVYSIAPAQDKDSILDYKSLALNGFRFPASGGDLIDDSVTRDLTINSLYYDPKMRLIVDPTGDGIEHLMAKPIKLATPYRGDDPIDQAEIVLRGLKFLFRFPNADASMLREWVKSLPEDLSSKIPLDKWPRVEEAWRDYIPQAHQSQAAKASHQLGPAAMHLIRALQDGRHNAS